MYWSRNREYEKGSKPIGRRTWRKHCPKGFCVTLSVLLSLIFLLALPTRCIAAEETLLSERERELIVRAVAAECPDASFGVQVGLAGVILRRLDSGRYGDDAACVVYAAGFLRCTKSGRIAGYIPEEILARGEYAVESAIRGGDPTNGALYFAAPDNHMTPPTEITYREGGYIFGKR